MALEVFMPDDKNHKKPNSEEARLQKDIDSIVSQLGLSGDESAHESQEEGPEEEAYTEEESLEEAAIESLENAPEVDIEESIQAAAQKLGVDVDLLRDVTAEEIQYLIDMCPYLQVVDTVLHYIDEPPPDVQFIQAKSGWKIFDYGDAMCSSAGERILNLSDSAQSDDDEGGDGTIWHQGIITAAEMVEIAKARGWKGLQIIDGHRIMKRSAWIVALREGLPVVGYEPTEADKKARARIAMSDSEYESLRHYAKTQSLR